MNYIEEIREVNRIIEMLNKKKITEKKYKVFNDGVLALLESAVENMKHVERARVDAKERLDEEMISSGKGFYASD